MSALKVLKLIMEEAENIQLVESVTTTGSKDFFLEGVYSTHTKENKNGRKYKKELLERELNRLIPEIKSKRLYGELNHPEKPEVDLKNACILVENLSWVDSDIMGKSYVLETPMGEIVRACSKRGIVGISSRGLGTVGDDGWVNEDYQMLTYDVVSTPSNRASWVKGIYESKQYVVNESGVIVREESVLTETEKPEAVADAISDMDEKIKLMVEAAVEDKLKTLEENKNTKQELDEATATKLYKNILQERIREVFTKLM